MVNLIFKVIFLMKKMMINYESASLFIFLINYQPGTIGLLHSNE